VQPHLGSQFFWKDVRPEFCWTIALCSKSGGLQKAQITLTSPVTANDVAGAFTTFKEEHRTTSPPGNAASTQRAANFCADLRQRRAYKPKSWTSRNIDLDGSEHNWRSGQ
jgi:hypothetical protein